MVGLDNLTDEQSQLLYILKDWFLCHTKEKPYYSYSGQPGTGKSSIVQCLIDILHLHEEEVASAAYTGKAALNLVKLGVSSSTIHSLIYNVIPVREKYEDDEGNIKFTVRLKFHLKEELDPAIRLIIIDEATMVNDKMKDQLLSFKIPIIFIGDNNQLPPVFGMSSVMLHPDFTLTKIMRQKENDPIVILANRILHNEPLFLGQYGKSSVIMDYDITPKILTDYDMVLCGKNKTREGITNVIRQDILHINSRFPKIGEKLICCQNNWDHDINGIYLINGLVGYLRDISMIDPSGNYEMISFQPDFMSNDLYFENIPLDRRYIKLDYEERKEYGLSKYNKFEFGYVISVHKSQGSEANRVLFIDEPFHDAITTKKLRYTAITRARESVTIIKTRPGMIANW